MQYSSVAEAHKGCCSEPIHIEDEVKDQEDGSGRWERQKKNAKRGSKRDQKKKAHDTWMVRRALTP